MLFYAAAVSSPQHFLLKNLVTCLCMVNYHYLLTRILLHEKAPGCPRDLEKSCKNSKKLHALKYLKYISAKHTNTIQYIKYIKYIKYTFQQISTKTS